MKEANEATAKAADQKWSAGKENAEEPGVCESEAKTLNSVIMWFKIAHVVCMIGCMSRELFAAEASLFGQFLRFIELICIPIYLSTIFEAYALLAVIMVREAPIFNGEDTDIPTTDLGALKERAADNEIARGFPVLKL